MYGIELRKGRDCIKHKIFIFAAAPGLFVLTCLTGESWIIRIAAAAVCGLAARLIPLLLAGRREKIRSRSYDMDLPDLLIHIAMFTEAGLNLRDAVERAAGIGSLERPLYRDLNEIFERIRRGSAKDFLSALEELAAQRKSVPLSNFCAMLTQNLRKGSGELGAMFTAQAQIYRNERRRIAAKLAEEAATLLLFPSAIVLIALILLLLAPAVMEIFGGI